MIRFYRKVSDKFAKYESNVLHFFKLISQWIKTLHGILQDISRAKNETCFFSLDITTVLEYDYSAIEW